ncbi:DUF2510 domain-containing protein, partial [Streptomyces kebangsaanensis]|uniref:DUF2510 domain-containing protein n=1 Tax=Streptomyces kebangsaanensis TaxID=864058 RepID=UPI0011613243
MSAPTPEPGEDRPREGYYPDPSIPGYVRYWNGSAWVPGTSRPAPADGEPLGPPPGARPAPAPAVEETGPHFFDEDDPALGPDPDPGPGPAEARRGGRPEPASAWGADRSRQSGFGGDQDHRVSWGADPRVPHAAEAGTPETPGDAPGIPGPGAPVDEGTMTFRPVPPRAFPAQGPSASGGGSAAGGPGFGAGKAAAERAAAAQGQAGSGVQGRAGGGPAQGPAGAPAG